MKRIAVCALLAFGIFGAEAAFAAKAGKPVVAVTEFRNESGAAWWRGGVGW
jgi:uncharacterized membrane protein